MQSPQVSEYIGLLDVFPDFVFIPERISEGDKCAHARVSFRVSPCISHDSVFSPPLCSPNLPPPHRVGRAVCLTWRCEVNGEEGPSGICECRPQSQPSQSQPSQFILTVPNPKPNSRVTCTPRSLRHTLPRPTLHAPPSRASLSF